MAARCGKPNADTDPMNYALLKTVHQTAVVLSISGFTLRAAGALTGAPWVRQRLARTLPHLIDTVLLSSALGLAWTASLSPLHTPWLLAKIIALLVYIALGMVALRPGAIPALRVLCGLFAVLAFAYIASVAVFKTPWGLLSLLSLLSLK